MKNDLAEVKYVFSLFLYSWKKVTVHSHNPWKLINMSEYKTSLVTVNLLNNGEHISNIKNVENVRTTCAFRLKEGWGQKSLSQVSASGMTTTSIDQARIQGGGPRGPWPPPPHKKLLPQIVRRRSRGGGSRGPWPPPLTKSWIRLCWHTLGNDASWRKSGGWNQAVVRQGGAWRWPH